MGLGLRLSIYDWTVENLNCFDLLEVTVDHYLRGGQIQRDAIRDLVGRIPLVAHGIGLSIGTDTELDLHYLDRVAAVIDELNMPFYSEHLAFTRVPGFDLANLLPLPKTEAVAENIIDKVRTVKNHVPVPFLFENISYLFDWPDSVMSDAEFFNLICGETGTGILLDVENLYVNSRNHDFNAYDFLDDLPAGVVKSVHIAGGVTVKENFLDRPILADSHSHPVPDENFDLLTYALVHHTPEAIVLERDERETVGHEILHDVARARECVLRSGGETGNDQPAPS